MASTTKTTTANKLNDGADTFARESEVPTVVEDAAAEAASVASMADSDDDLDSEDSLTFSNGVIEKIVAIAMRELPGVVGMKGGWMNRVQETFGQRDPRKGVTVEVTPDSSVRVNISIFIEYGAYAPKVFEDVKQAVINQVTGMTGLRVAGVNLRIEDVLTSEEIAARNAARGRTDRETPALEAAIDEDEEA